MKWIYIESSELVRCGLESIDSQVSELSQKQGRYWYADRRK